MKKRSLFVALAMLIVSAIVLTSATYAWFSTAGTLTIESFSASVDAGDGGLLISARNGNNAVWTTTLKYADYNFSGNTNSLIGSADGSGNYTAGTMVPVSGLITGTSTNASGVTFKGGSMEGNLFTGAGATNGTYLDVTTYFMSKNVGGSCDVTCGFSSDVNYVQYVLVVKDEDGEIVGSKVLSKNGGDYLPITSASGSANDANGDYILNASEISNGSGVTSGTNAKAPAAYGANEKITVAITAGEVYSATVYMWAEGQDAACVDGANSSASTAALGFSFTPSST